MSRGIHGLAALLALVVCAGAAAPAQAAIRYVDDQGTATTGCTSTSTPCATIGEGIAAASSGDSIHVGGGTYGENLALPAGVSLEKASFSSLNPAIHTSGSATIDGAGGGAIEVSASDGTPRVIDGFTLQGGAGYFTPVLNAPDPGALTVSHNLFQDDSSRQIDFVGGAVHITGDTFSGTDDGDDHSAIEFYGGSPEIDHNTISGYDDAIDGDASTPNIHDNTIAGAFVAPMVFVGAGIRLVNSGGVISDNRVAASPSNPADYGIDVTGSSPLPVISRNRVFGFAGYGAILGGSDPFVLADDVFGNNGTGLFVNDPAGISATGITASNSIHAPDISLSAGTPLTVHSSIVGNAGVAGALNSSCTSTFSRGPIGECGFATSADPGFVDPSGDNFRLSPGSPMIDAGDPAAPGAGELDVVGNPRAVLGLPGCTPRRDIGGFEFVPAQAIAPSGCPVPVPTPPEKKCKKHHKLRRGKCVKKKHGRKH